MTPLHHAIYSKHVSACKLILEYDKVSSQNISDPCWIRNSKVVARLFSYVPIFCFLFFRALSTLSSVERFVVTVKRHQKQEIYAPSARLQYIVTVSQSSLTKHHQLSATLQLIKNSFLPSQFLISVSIEMCRRDKKVENDYFSRWKKA